MKHQRPVFLDLTQIRQPLPAIISILHRLSGLLLFLALPVCLSLWQMSLKSAEDFGLLQQSMLGKAFVFLAGAAFLYHALAGLRFLMLDLHWSMSLFAARRSAGLVALGTLIGSLLWGAWLW